MGVEVLPHRRVVAEHLRASFVRTRDGAGHLVKSLLLWFDPENEISKLHVTNNYKIPPSPGKVCKLLGVGQVEPGDAADRDLLAGHVLGVVRVRLVRGHVLPHLKDAIFSVFCRKCIMILSLN